MSLVGDAVDVATGGMSIWMKIGAAVAGVALVVAALYGTAAHFENIGYQRRIVEEQAAARLGIHGGVHGRLHGAKKLRTIGLPPLARQARLAMLCH